MMTALTKPWAADAEPTQHADASLVFYVFSVADCLALNDAREYAYLEAGGIAGRRLIDSRE